jgi:hypothetical protein
VNDVAAMCIAPVQRPLSVARPPPAHPTAPAPAGGADGAGAAGAAAAGGAAAGGGGAPPGGGRAAPVEFHFWRRVSTEASASPNGLALCRTGPPAPPGAAQWRGGLVEPPVDTAGRAYAEFQITRVGEGESRCGALLGVTWEDRYPGSGGLNLSHRALLFNCGSSRAQVVCGDEVGHRDRGPRRSGFPIFPAQTVTAPGRLGPSSAFPQSAQSIRSRPLAVLQRTPFSIAFLAVL